MLNGLRLTLQESVRYRGRTGHYSWILHRTSGLAILGFLVIHTWDTANAHFAPGVYQWTINVFKHPLFGLGEIAVFGAVIYHAFNGLRITLLDFKPEWWHLQNQSALVVWVLFAILFIPLGGYLFWGIIESCGHSPVWTVYPSGNEMTGNSCWSLPPLSHFTQG